MTVFCLCILTLKDVLHTFCYTAGKAGLTAEAERQSSLFYLCWSICGFLCWHMKVTKTTKIEEEFIVIMQDCTKKTNKLWGQMEGQSAASAAPPLLINRTGILLILQWNIILQKNSAGQTCELANGVFWLLGHEILTAVGSFLLLDPGWAERWPSWGLKQWRRWSTWVKSSRIQQWSAFKAAGSQPAATCKLILSSVLLWVGGLLEFRRLQKL